MSLKMKSQVLDEMIERLRSGKYEQGSGYLRYRSTSGDQFCCLGILCEMAAEEGVIERVVPDGENRKAFTYKDPNDADQKTHSSYLPGAVIEWAGIVSDVEKSGAVGSEVYRYEEQGAFGEDPTKTLAYMNDNGIPFDHIADWMEANVVRV